MDSKELFLCSHLLQGDGCDYLVEWCTQCTVSSAPCNIFPTRLVDVAISFSSPLTRESLLKGQYTEMGTVMFIVVILGR
jgi:hypothetical protein